MSAEKVSTSQSPALRESKREPTTVYKALKTILSINQDISRTAFQTRGASFNESVSMVMKNEKNRSNESIAYDELDSNPVLPAISDDIKLSLGSE